MASIVGASVAFVVAGKLVSVLWPTHHSTGVRDEMNRHNLATEAYTEARNKWGKRIRARMEKEHYFDRLNKEGETRKAISLDHIESYAKKRRLSSPPAFEDFYRTELARGKAPAGGLKVSEYNNTMKTIAITAVGSVASYLIVKNIYIERGMEMPELNNEGYEADGESEETTSFNEAAAQVGDFDYVEQARVFRDAWPTDAYTSNPNSVNILTQVVTEFKRIPDIGAALRNEDPFKISTVTETDDDGVTVAGPSLWR